MFCRFRYVYISTLYIWYELWHYYISVRASIIFAVFATNIWEVIIRLMLILLTITVNTFQTIVVHINDEKYQTPTVGQSTLPILPSRLHHTVPVLSNHHRPRDQRAVRMTSHQHKTWRSQYLLYSQILHLRRMTMTAIQR